MSWVAAALLAALCAGITSILAKCGVRDADSDIATGIRTAVVLIFAWLVVFVTDAQVEWATSLLVRASSLLPQELQ